MGNKGRIVLPVEIRQRHGWDEGTVLIAVEHDDGSVSLHSRDELLAEVRRELSNSELVEPLLAERRAASKLEDAGLG